MSEFQSYNEQILQSIIDGTPYNNVNPYPSNIEILLMQLKGVIEQGNTAIADVIDSEAKNVLDFDNIGTSASSDPSSVVLNGVRFTVNTDRSVTAVRESTSTGDSNCVLRMGNGSNYVDDLCNGNYILSGCPQGGSADTYEITALNTGGDYRVIDNGEGVILPAKGDNQNIYVRLLVDKSVPVGTTIVFKPMICTASAWNISQAYQPYRPSYQELYEMVQALQAEA